MFFHACRPAFQDGSLRSPFGTQPLNQKGETDMKYLLFALSAALLVGCGYALAHPSGVNQTVQKITAVFPG